MDRFEQNDYGVPYNPESPPQSPTYQGNRPADNREPYIEEYPDNETVSTIDYGTGEPYTEEYSANDHDLKPSHVLEMALELGIADKDSFHLFAQDREVRDTISWLLYNDLRDLARGSRVDLHNFAGWQAARGVYLTEMHNAEALGAPDRYGSREHTAAVIVAAFERLDFRLRVMGHHWRSASVRWRVFYGVLLLYLTCTPDMLYHLVASQAEEEDWTGEEMNRMVSVSHALRAYAEMML